jgi:hypothetical protein
MSKHMSDPLRDCAQGLVRRRVIQSKSSERGAVRSPIDNANYGRKASSLLSKRLFISGIWLSI